ncbi:MAG: hypothetical protein Q8R12_00445, partial [bacterium]|nr:hypothetical protein [bacterium]
SSNEERKKFSSLFRYQQGFFDASEGYKNLKNVLEMHDRKWNTCANKLFYLAVPPEYYKQIFKNLASSHLTDPCSPKAGLVPLEINHVPVDRAKYGETERNSSHANHSRKSLTGWNRIIVEKPFGKNLKTAEELDKMLGRLFKEEQVYRIDHYLGKETVQNILAFRFSNSFLDPAWNKEYIEEISIRLLESGGVEDRGDFYDGLGALRDVGQNHLLQLLALFTMENPGTFEGNSIRQKRGELLKSLRIPESREIFSDARRGQYEGYRSLEGVSSRSLTETYFWIKAFLDTPRWRGVPIILESGKGLPESKAEVRVTFRHHTPCLCPESRHVQNVLRYHIQPKEGVSTSFWVKRPGT